MRACISFIICVFLFSINAESQDTTRTRWRQQVKQSLGMTETQFAQFIKTGEKYDKKVSNIIRDSSLDRNTKMLEIEKIQTERRSVIKKLLSEDQVKKLGELERQRAIAKGSPYYKRRQELEARMKQRNLERARADSARKKQAAGQ